MHLPPRTLCLISSLALLFSPASAAERLQVKSAALNEAVADETYKKITSVLVMHENEIIYESYWGDGGEEILNDTRSATKSLTAMAMGAAIADGYIDSVDTRAFAWFDDHRPFRFSTALKEEITIRDLLTMSSALDCNDNVWESPGNEEHMYPARKWLYFVLDMPIREDYARNGDGYGPFSYCTAGSFLLGQIIERAVGEPVDEYIEKRLLTPLGINRIEWDRSPSGEVMTGGGAELTSRDLMKLGALVRNKGVYNGVRILPALWIDKMNAVHVAVNDEQDYGFQWWRRDFRCGDADVSGWYMAGNGGNKIVVFDELALTVVVTARLYGTRGMHQQSTEIIEDFVLAGHARCNK